MHRIDLGRQDLEVLPPFFRSSSRLRNIAAEKQLQFLRPAAYPECELRRIVVGC